MRYLLFVSFLLATALGCGGGGGGGEAVTLSGRLSAVTAQPLRPAPFEPGPDLEPNDLAAAAPLLRGEAEGRVDARSDAVDVFRVVATTDGPVRALLDADGFHGEVFLHDLARGTAAKTLDVEKGTVFDVIVRARAGAGRYRVSLRDGEGDRTPRPLPETYRDCGDGHVPGEIIAAPLPGVTPEALAAFAGLESVKGTGRLCLLRAPETPPADEFRALCQLLARCARLEADGLVRYAEPNYYRRLAGRPDDPLFPDQWALEQVRAPAAWELLTSTTRVVAVVDSGIRRHPDLVANLVPGYDFEADDDDPTDPTPNLSHGTQVAGLIAAAGNNGEGVAGMIWNARVMPLRAFDSAGLGTAFDIANAILYAAGEPNESGTVPAETPVAINLSFASPLPTVAEEDACDTARANGLFLCAAAGNHGLSSPRYPAAYASVLACAATTLEGTRASYSNFGSWIDLAAPGGTSGTGVVTTGVLAGGQFGYPRVSGTSFSSPHVVAVAAMCRTVAPGLSSDELETILTSTAQDVGAPGFDVFTGHGVVDAYRALLAALGRPPPLLMPFEEVEVRLVQLPSLSVMSSVTTSEAGGLAFAFTGVPPGRYRLEAGTDRNHDGSISGPGEVSGRWTDGRGVEVLIVTEARTDLDFAIAPQ